VESFLFGHKEHAFASTACHSAREDAIKNDGEDRLTRTSRLQTSRLLGSNSSKAFAGKNDQTSRAACSRLHTSLASMSRRYDAFLDESTKDIEGEGDDSGRRRFRGTQL
jgi:hypothetical protein